MQKHLSKKRFPTGADTYEGQWRQVNLAEKQIWFENASRIVAVEESYDWNNSIDSSSVIALRLGFCHHLVTQIKNRWQLTCLKLKKLRGKSVTTRSTQTETQPTGSQSRQLWRRINKKRRLCRHHWAPSWEKCSNKETIKTVKSKDIRKKGKEIRRTVFLALSIVCSMARFT